MKLYRSKLDWIAPYVDGRAVLDLGCVCHDLDQTAVPWLHAFLLGRADRVLGVDYLEDQVARMRDQGYHAVTADVQTMDLGETFDVLVAGDIIEHLDNPGLFLDRCCAHMKPDGRLLITTPNPVNVVRLIRTLFKGAPGANGEHTCWFTAQVLRQLAARHGLEVVDEAYVNDTRLFYPWFKPQHGSALRRLGRHANRLAVMLLLWGPARLKNAILSRLRPRTAETLCLALRKTA